MLKFVMKMSVNVARLEIGHKFYLHKGMRVLWTHFYFSFKIHCLQMLQLFVTEDGPFFFIVTLVTLFFAVSPKNIYSIYCFGHSSSQSVSQ